MKSIYDVIRRPIITEKSTSLHEVDNQVVFEVDKRANKHEIREAIEKLFGVKVNSVNTAIMRGKPKRMGRMSGNRSSYKKAVVTLREGERLELAEMVSGEDDEEGFEGAEV